MLLIKPKLKEGNFPSVRVKKASYGIISPSEAGESKEPSHLTSRVDEAWKQGEFFLFLWKHLCGHSISLFIYVVVLSFVSFLPSWHFFIGEYWNSTNYKNKLFVKVHYFPYGLSEERGFLMRNLILIYLHLLIIPYLCRKSKFTRNPPIRDNYICWSPRMGSFLPIEANTYVGSPRMWSLSPIESNAYARSEKMGSLSPIEAITSVGSPRE